MLFDLGWPLRPPRIMNTKAEPKLAKIAKNAIATMNFMSAIITLPRTRAFAWVTLATLLGVVLTVRLGVWQLSRAEQKQARHDAIVAQQSAPVIDTQAVLVDKTQFTQLHRRVVLRGQWLPQYTVYLDNRPMNGHTGFWVLTPLQVDAHTRVLVQRGWIPRHSLDRTLLAPIVTPKGDVQVQGRFAPPPSSLMRLSDASEQVAQDNTSPILENLDLAAYAARTGVVDAAVMLQTDAPSDGLLRNWPEISAGVEKHIAYAFQWFALAALQLGLYAWFQFISPQRHARRS